MTILSTPERLNSTLTRLIKQYDHFEWAVAWASRPLKHFEALKKAQQKVRRLVVGTHFYQTHPDFIEAYLNHPKVTFVLQFDGTFHPKLYYFEKNNGDWECIIGSPNFTNGAFNENSEIAVLLSSRDENAVEIQRTIFDTLSKYQSMSRKLSQSEFNYYKNLYHRTNSARQRINGKYGTKKTTISPLDIEILKMDWHLYCQKVMADRNFEKRTIMLQEISKLLSNKRHFKDLSYQERRHFAGFEDKEIEWSWFGSMKANGRFQKIVNSNNINLSKALDVIPNQGIIVKDHFLMFVDIFKKAFENGHGDGVATATRFLAMKRPDYFVCFTGLNKAGLEKAFQSKIHTKGYMAYWDEIVCRIIDSNWWNSPKPKNSNELYIWLARAAFLDSIFKE